jgi:hypothetical protein
MSPGRLQDDGLISPSLMNSSQAGSGPCAQCAPLALSPGAGTRRHRYCICLSRFVQRVPSEPFLSAPHRNATRRSEDGDPSGRVGSPRGGPDEPRRALILGGSGFVRGPNSGYNTLKLVRV